jgi:hypothetical protein
MVMNDSSDGRWVSPKPSGVKIVNLEDPQTRTLYAYVHGKPTTLNDPTGLVQECSVAEKRTGQACSKVVNPELEGFRLGAARAPRP